MTPTTATVYPGQTAGLVQVSTIATVQTPSGGTPPPGMPASIPRSQLYYWSAKWQEDEAESLGELEAGQGVRFETGRDAVRWLLSAEE